MEKEILSKSSFMRRKLYIRKTVFYYKKEVRIWKRKSSMRRQFYYGISKKFF